MINNYRLSFTGASFFLYESIELAKLYIVLGSWDEAVKAVIDSNVNKRSKSTIKRESSEIVIRLKTLSEELLEKFVSSDPDDAKIILLYAIFKSYPIIKLFCIDVLYDKTLMLDHDIQEYEINMFFRQQEELHEVYEKKSDMTKKKLKQVMFKILADANLIKSTLSKVIIKPYIDTAISKMIVDDSDESYLRALLMSESEIAMLGVN